MSTAFLSEKTFDQASFAAWLATITATDLNEYELLDGRIVMNPPSGWPYGDVEEELFKAFAAYAAARGCEAHGPTAGYELPTGDTVAPDASLILPERLRAGPKPRRRKFRRIVPNIVGEVISGTSRKRDSEEKRRIYAAAGVEEYWLVDPDEGRITVLHRRADGSYDDGVTFGRGLRVCSRRCPDLSPEVDEILLES